VGLIAVLVACSVTVPGTAEPARVQGFHAARDTSVAVPGTVTWLQRREDAGGGFAEPGGSPSPQLTAWAVLGLRAVGARPTHDALAYLRAHEDELTSPTDVELGAMAEFALGSDPTPLLDRVERVHSASGAIGRNVNSTIWGILAFRQARRHAPSGSIRYLLRQQSRSGGWSWYPRGAPDSNDTAAAIQALRSAGVRGKPIRRGLAYLHRLQNKDGGFELTPGRGSDAQSTAWAIQAYAAAHKPTPRGALAYLRRLRRSDGSFRYSKRYGTTPVWVTSQVLAALARRPFPL
jgi:hypothetical protein